MGHGEAPPRGIERGIWTGTWMVELFVPSNGVELRAPSSRCERSECLRCADPTFIQRAHAPAARVASSALETLRCAPSPLREPGQGFQLAGSGVGGLPGRSAPSVRGSWVIWVRALGLTQRESVAMFTSGGAPLLGWRRRRRAGGVRLPGGRGEDVKGDMACTVGLEHTRASVNGEPHRYWSPVTHPCRREDGHWKLAHRHVDTLPSQMGDVVRVGR
jgi:hypothetical protein